MPAEFTLKCQEEPVAKSPVSLAAIVIGNSRTAESAGCKFSRTTGGFGKGVVAHQPMASATQVITSSVLASENRSFRGIASAGRPASVARRLLGAFGSADLFLVDALAGDAAFGDGDYEDFAGRRAFGAGGGDHAFAGAELHFARGEI